MNKKQFFLTPRFKCYRYARMEMIKKTPGIGINVLLLPLLQRNLELAGF